LLLSAACLLCQCARRSELKPAAGTPVDSADPATAVARSSGVAVEVSANLWNGNPENLTDALLPLFVSVKNLSGETLWISYADCAVVGDSGARYPALELNSMNRSVKGQRTAMSRDRAGDSNVTLRTVSIPLPTAEMREQAFPQGVVRNGGREEGFLYFDDATKVETRFSFGVVLRGEDREPRLVMMIPFVTGR